VFLLTAVAVDRFGCVGCVEVRFLIRARGHRCTTFYPPGSARLLPVCALRWVNRWVERAPSTVSVAGRPGWVPGTFASTPILRRCRWLSCEISRVRCGQAAQALSCAPCGTSPCFR
jgi:hypothetical protein